jgi:hypothetical protein
MNVNILARNIKTVGIEGLQVDQCVRIRICPSSINISMANNQSIAFFRIKCPIWRILQLQALNKDILGALDVNYAGTIFLEFKKLDRTPPCLSIAINNTLSGAGEDDIFNIFQVNTLFDMSIISGGPGVAIVNESQCTINLHSKIMNSAGLNTATHMKRFMGDKKYIARLNCIQGSIEQISIRESRLIGFVERFRTKILKIENAALNGNQID